MYTIGMIQGYTAVSLHSTPRAQSWPSDTPTVVIRVQRGTRQVYDAPGLVELLRPYAGLHSHVTIEEAQPMPGQGTRSTFTTGYGMGI